MDETQQSSAPDADDSVRPPLSAPSARAALMGDVIESSLTRSWLRGAAIGKR
jgi:hypothetical protein